MEPGSASCAGHLSIIFKPERIAASSEKLSAADLLLRRLKEILGALVVVVSDFRVAESVFFVESCRFAMSAPFRVVSAAVLSSLLALPNCLACDAAAVITLPLAESGLIPTESCFDAEAPASCMGPHAAVETTSAATTDQPARE